MEPNFVRLKVPAELKNNLQVGGISVANYRHEELVLNFNVCRSSWTWHRNLRRAKRPDRHFCQVGNGKWNCWTLSTSFGLTVCFFFSGGKHLLVLRLSCGVSLTSLHCFHTSTFRRFLLKILWQCKYCGNRIQFGEARNSFEMNWTYSKVPHKIKTVQATGCNPSHTPLSFWYSHSSILICVVLREWKY